jgi:hypothetical protein
MYDENPAIFQSDEGRRKQKFDEEIKGENEAESHSTLNELKLRLKVYIISRCPEAHR